MSLTGSLTEARELDLLLSQIMAKLKEVNASIGASNTADAKIKLTEAKISFYEVYFVARRMISILRRMGLPEQVDEVLSRMQHMIMAVRSLSIALTALEVQTLGVWAILKFATGLIVGFYSLGEALDTRRSR